MEKTLAKPKSDIGEVFDPKAAAHDGQFFKNMVDGARVMDSWPNFPLSSMRFPCRAIGWIFDLENGSGPENRFSANVPNQRVVLIVEAG